VRKRWGIAALFIGMAAFGVVWWLSLNNWSFEGMVPSRESQHFSRHADSVDFSGVYAIHGPGYTGTLTIRRAGDGYNLCWELSSGSIYYGNGLAMGDVLGAVCAVERHKHTRVLAYKKEADGLSGLGARMDGDKLGCEKTANAERIKASVHPLTGVYKVQGSHPNETSYKGEMTLERTGATYTVRCRASDGSGYCGTGFAVDDVFVTGYSNAMGVGIAVYEIKSSGLEGRWLYTDYDRLATTSQIRAGRERASK
jgi:hypothetical protein